jgi:hypothetical protein
MMAGLSHEPERKGCIPKIIAVDEIHAGAAHGGLDLFLEVVVDAEALEVVDGGHHLPAALPALLQNLLHVRQALLKVKVSAQQQRFGSHQRGADDDGTAAAAVPSPAVPGRRRSCLKEKTRLHGGGEAGKTFPAGIPRNSRDFVFPDGVRNFIFPAEINILIFSVEK